MTARRRYCPDPGTYDVRTLDRLTAGFAVPDPTTIVRVAGRKVAAGGWQVWHRFRAGAVKLGDHVHVELDHDLGGVGYFVTSVFDSEADAVALCRFRRGGRYVDIAAHEIVLVEGSST